MKNKMYIIDGNSYIYRAFYALPPMYNSKNQPVNAIYGFVRMMLKILTKDDVDYCVVCFDYPAKNFRHDMCEEYKANRSKMPDELIAQIPFIKQSVRDMGLTYLEEEGFEADDLIATLTKKSINNDLDVIIVSEDKDILQLVSNNVKVLSSSKDVVFDEGQVQEKFGIPPNKIRDFFALVGDSSDNIKGVPGIGKVTAKKLLEKYNSVNEMLLNTQNIEPKYKDKIEQFKDILKLSYELIGLKNDVSLGFDLNQYVFKQNCFSEEFKKFLEDMEFHAIIKSIYTEDVKTRENDYKVCDDFANIQDECISISLHKNEAGQIIDLVIGTRNKEIYVLNTEKFDEWQNIFIENIENIENIYVDDFKGLFELFYKKGVSLNYDKFFDVVVAGYLIDSSLQNFESILKRYEGKALGSDKGLDNAVERAIMIHSVSSVLEHLLIEYKLTDVFKNIEMPFCKILVKMEDLGIKIDVQYLQELSKQFQLEIDCLENKIFKDAGQEFNINSPKQLAVILFEKLGLPVIEKTKTGNSTSEYVLKILSMHHDLPEKILSYRELKKLKSTYIDVLPILADKDTSRVHTTFNHTNTTTGRLSSSNPNLQNIPVKTEIAKTVRKAFVSEKGYVLLSSDYSQIDLRVLAHLCEDKAMLEAFNNNEDIHTRTASDIFNKNVLDITKKEREIAKRINFGLVYGMSGFGLSKDMGITLTEANEFIKAYFVRYPGVKEFMNKTIQFVNDNGYVNTILGRRRYIPEIKSKIQKIRLLGERFAINTPVQGSSADVLKKAMVDLQQGLSGYGDKVRMLLQIHDEIICEVHESIVSEISGIVVDKMENTIKLNVPLKVTTKIGMNWSEMNRL